MRGRWFDANRAHGYYLGTSFVYARREMGARGGEARMRWFAPVALVGALVLVIASALSGAPAAGSVVRAHHRHALPSRFYSRGHTVRCHTRRRSLKHHARPCVKHVAYASKRAGAIRVADLILGTPTTAVVLPEHDPSENTVTPGPHRSVKTLGPASPAPAGAGPVATSALVARPHAADDQALDVFQDTDLAPVIGTDSAFEPSAARASAAVFYTFNWGAAFSSDGGQTFSLVDAKGDLNGVAGGFCCDQVVEYVKQIDRFVWVRQTYPGANLENRYRVAVSSPRRLLDSNGTDWSTFDLTPETYNYGGQKLGMDYPGLAITTNYLYLTFNVTDLGKNSTVSLIVHRIPLSDLRNLSNGGSLGPTQYFAPANITWARAAQTNPDATTLAGNFAAMVNTSTLRAYQWPDGADAQVISRDVAISSVPQSISSQLPNNGGDWMGQTSKVNTEVQGAAQSGNAVWYAWTGGIGGKFKQAHIEYVILSTRTLGGGMEGYIQNPDFAFGWPDLATSENNEVGITYAWGGGSYYAHAGVGIISPQPRLLNVTAGDGLGSGGHYMTIRPDDGTNLFTVGVYILQTDPAKKYASGLQSHPLFEVFGHVADKPPASPSGTPVPALKQGATLTLACPGQVQAGNSISVSGGLISTSAQAQGHLVPAGPGSGIDVHYVGPHGTTDDHAVTSSSGGTYSDGETTTSADTGTWGIQASWDGNDSYGPARSAQCLVRVVSPPPPNTTPSTVKLRCPSGTLQYGQTSTVTGSIIPSRPGVQVHLTYVPADPAESELDRNATTNSSSAFSDSVVLGGGDWSVQAYWNGDAQTQGATSASCDVFVEPRIG